MSKSTILVVDDEALIRWSLGERLKSEGSDVLEADTGATALEKLSEGVDLVLLDYKLPDTDRVAVLRKIKEFDQDILVILLTAFKRVGGAQDIHVDARVVAATNRDLEDEVAKGRFRSDLYYRLNVLPIALPPLRAHAEDVPLLVEYYIDAFNTEFRKRVLGASTAAHTMLQQYGLPGNVAALLGLNRDQIRYRIEKFGLTVTH